MNNQDFHLIDKQYVTIEDPFTNNDSIIDLGGGGEGVIGIVRGKQVTAIDLRKDELDEIPNGPIKVIADARDLPFKNEHFSAATSFFFLMYVEQNDRLQIIKEAFRVLKNGSYMYIWDVIIPKQNLTDKKIFALPLQVKIIDKTINTIYGTKWDNRALSCEEISSLAKKSGFTVINESIDDQIFYLVLQKPRN